MVSNFYELGFQHNSLLADFRYQWGERNHERSRSLWVGDQATVLSLTACATVSLSAGPGAVYVEKLAEVTSLPSQGCRELVCLLHPYVPILGHTIQHCEIVELQRWEPL